MCNSSTDYPYPISDETIDTAARLGADILIRYKLGRAVHGQTVHMHREYVATQCPGDYFALQYGLQRYCDLVNKYIDGGKDMQGQVITWDLHKGDNQQWARVVRGDHIALVNRATQKVLDVNGESTEQGTLAIIWDEKKPEPSLNQLWKEETVIVDGAQFLRYRSALTGFVLDAKGAGYADGTPAILWPENGQLNQCWIKVPTDDGWFVLLNANSGDALDAIL